ncbi:MAG: hypothetical protein ACQESB_01290 [Elusimicrobiota bacterium]
MKKKKRSKKAYIIIFTAIALAAGAIFFIRPFVLKHTSHFNSGVFGFNIPPGFSSVRVPNLPSVFNLDFAVLRAGMDSEEALRVLQRYAHSGSWRTMSLNRDSDLDIEALPGVSNMMPDIDSQKNVYKRGSEFMSFTAVPVGGLTIVFLACGDSESVSFR